MNTIRKNKRFYEELTLAEMLSVVLNHPELPEILYNGIQDVICDMFNSGDQTEMIEYEKSAPYINQVLRGYQAAEREVATIDGTASSDDHRGETLVLIETIENNKAAIPVGAPVLELGVGNGDYVLIDSSKVPVRGEWYVAEAEPAGEGELRIFQKETGDTPDEVLDAQVLTESSSRGDACVKALWGDDYHCIGVITHTAKTVANGAHAVVERMSTQP